MLKKKRSGAPNWIDPDDAPRLTEDHFRKADVFDGAKLVRRGRPKAERGKRAVSLRLSQDVLEHFRSGGPGWQTRINAVLEKAVARAKRP